MNSEDTKTLIGELVMLANWAINDRSWRRLRIAVTPEEYEALAEYAFKEREEDFWGTIRGVALVKDELPKDPLIEFRPRGFIVSR
jgi:hypothetical protein